MMRLAKCLVVVGVVLFLLMVATPERADAQVVTAYYPASPVVTYQPVVRGWLFPRVVYRPTYSYATAAPVTTYYYSPAPVTTYYSPAPVTTYYAPAPVSTSYAPAPVTTYYAPAPVTTYYRSYYAPARVRTYYTRRPLFYYGY